MADKYQYVKLPDGSYGKFPADASDSLIKVRIMADFPDAFKPPPPQLTQEQKASETRMMALAGMTGMPTPNMTPEQRESFARGKVMGALSNVAVGGLTTGAAAAPGLFAPSQMVFPGMRGLAYLPAGKKILELLFKSAAGGAAAGFSGKAGYDIYQSLFGDK